MATAAEFHAMTRAIELAATVDAEFGPNPRVGCVLLSRDGSVIAEGAHAGVGTPHAEVLALTCAGERAHGATAVVTLEPCRHTGKTGPCTEALMRAGIRRVVFGQHDPNPVAAQGAAELTAGGIDVEGGVLAVEAANLNAKWSVAVSRGRPYVTLKIAATLDGRIAAEDGSSRWITGPEAREQVHQLRSESDAVIVGTGTAIADDPALTDRRPGATRQPVPVVFGMRALPGELALSKAGALQIRTHDVAHALDDLYNRGFRQVLVEGGPTLATALISAQLVDELIWYVAPVVLGGGLPALNDLHVTTIGDAPRWQRNRVTTVGNDVRIDLTPISVQSSGGSD